MMKPTIVSMSSDCVCPVGASITLSNCKPMNPPTAPNGTLNITING